jgi:hypothetical protein
MAAKETAGADHVKSARIRRTRAETLEDIDIQNLPSPPIETVPAAKRDLYAARSAALRMWVDESPAKDIEAKTSLTCLAARRLAQQAIQKDPVTGQLLGFFVCIPGYKSPLRKPPTRSKPFDPHHTACGAGLSGALTDCFKRYPAIHDGMLQFARCRRIGEAPPVALITRKSLIEAFHSLCRRYELDVRGEWPFNKERRGENAIWEWYSKRKWDWVVGTVTNEQGDEAGKLERIDQKAAASGYAAHARPALDRLELDEHRFHAMFEILAPAPGGRFITCGARRPWALAVVDRESWVCMASTISWRSRYNTSDVMRLLTRAIKPPHRLNLTIQNTSFCYLADAAYPAEVMGTRLWRELALDADSCHISPRNLQAAKDVLKCDVVSERLGEATARAGIEGFNAYLAEFMEALPSSTGNSPSSAAWRGPEGAAIRYHLAAPIAEELLDVYVRNWNAKGKAACGGVSPLARLQDMINTQRAFDKPLDAAIQKDLWKLLPRYEATITRQRGNSGPFRINFHGAYGSRELADHPEIRYLRDKRVHLFVQEDARFAFAVPFERQELTFAVALLGRHRRMPSTLEFRRMLIGAEKNAACAGRAGSPHLVMGILEGLGELARTSDPASSILAGTVGFMNRHGLGNEEYICLPPEVRDSLLEYADRADATEEEPESTLGRPALGERPIPVVSNLFGQL